MKKIVCLLFAVALSLVICAKEDTCQYIPQPPDYQQAAMWYASLQDAGDKGADVFYIVSTWEMDWKANDGRVCHYADVWNPVHREHMAIEMGKIASYMAEGNHFYAPYYRHLAIDSWMTQNNDTILHDTITVTLDPQYHVLVVKGYSGAEYPAFRDFVNVGDIHSCEPWLYSECLKKNIALRVREWRKKNKE